MPPRAGAAPADKLHRIASLITAFATVYLVYCDGRPAFRDVAVLESSLDELRERFARLEILGCPGD